MRGKLAERLPAPQLFGITPADAGKTKVYNSKGGQIKDHPRGCGENYSIYTIMSSV